MSRLTMHPIRTDADYTAVMNRIARLAEDDPLPGSHAADELEVLSLLIRSYEETAFPIPEPTLDEALTFRAEQMGMTAKDLDALFGGSGRRSEVLTGRRALSKAMANRLRAIGVPDRVVLRVLLGEQRRSPPVKVAIARRGARPSSRARPRQRV